MHSKDGVVGLALIVLSFACLQSTNPFRMKTFFLFVGGKGAHMDGQLSCQLELFNYIKLHLNYLPYLCKGALGTLALKLMKSLIPEPLGIIFRFGKMH